MAILKGLVTVAWADGRIAQEETELIEALLDAFEASPSERRELKVFAKSPRTIDDVPVDELGHDDRRVLLQHAVLISYIDGTQDEKERKVLDALAGRLGVPEQEAVPLMTAAADRVKANLHLLQG